MRCLEHTVIHARTSGQQSTCLTCNLPLIYDGEKWQVQWTLPKHKVDALRRVYNFNRLIVPNFMPEPGEDR